MIKPNIIISKCINFDNCRYNGGIIKDSFLELLGRYVNYIPVCQEVAIGLPTSSSSIRIFKYGDGLKLYQPETENDLTKKMNTFSKKFLKSKENIDGFVLKNGSPSCGIGDVKIYDKKDAYSFSKKGKGIFTENIDKFYGNIPKEDEGRLKNFKLREEFLTKIFCLADFRNIKKNLIISELSYFQAKNKYLFMFYSPEIQKKLGQIAASYDKTNIKEIFDNYNLKLLEIFTAETKIGKMINSLTHIFGYFKDNCSSEEKVFFLETLQAYREGKIPTSSVVFILKTLALRDKKEYIIKQTILNPFPKELIQLSDSGKLLKL